MNSQKAPEPPDPMDTARAQSQMNRETAITQTGLNAMNQRTPYGSLTYNRIGRWPDGTPRFEATQQLSPGQQTLLNQQEQFGKLFGETALAQGGKVQETLSSPFDLSNEATEGRLMELGRSRLDPYWNERRQSEEANLAARGVMPGSEAYDRAMRGLEQNRNDAYTQLLLQGRGQSVQEALTQRNQPLNEIIAMMTGSQVQQPSFVNTPQTQVSPTNLGQIVNSGYQNQLAAFNANQANDPLGSILGTAGTIGGWALSQGTKPWIFSDERLKDDYGVVGEANGMPVHAYAYKGERPGMMRLGLMAQEVAKVKPEAVRKGPGGMMQVHYRRAMMA